MYKNVMMHKYEELINMIYIYRHMKQYSQTCWKTPWQTQLSDLHPGFTVLDEIMIAMTNYASYKVTLNSFLLKGQEKIDISVDVVSFWQAAASNNYHIFEISDIVFKDFMLRIS